MASTSVSAPSPTVPESPTDLNRRDYLTALKRTFAEIKTDDVPGLAGGVAFKMFLSLFPSLLAAVAVFSIVTTPGEIAEMIEQARGVLPGAAVELINRPLEELANTKTGTAGIAAALGIATGLVSATGAAVSLMKALSRAYDVAETRKFLRQRLIGLLLTLALIVALVGIALLLVVGGQLQTSLLPGVVPPLAYGLAAVRFVLALAVLVLLFAFVYWAGPNRDHPSWVWMSPGALFGVIGWLVVAGGFSLYAETADSYPRTYGTIIGVVVLLIWLQLSMLVILVGAEFNAEVERMRSLHVRVGEGAGFAQPAVAAAWVPSDIEAGLGTLSQGQGEAHTLQTPAPPPVEDTVRLRAPIPPVAPETAPAVAETNALAPEAPALLNPPSARTAGAAAAALTAAAVFLGFARRRARR